MTLHGLQIWSEYCEASYISIFLPGTQLRFLSHPANNLFTIANALTGLRFYNTLQPH